MNNMKKQLVANWKMNPMGMREALSIARASDHKGVIVCPPFPFIHAVQEVLKRAELGAQDLFWEQEGAYTGEVSGGQLKRLGVRYVIIGHSERRHTIGETDEMVGKKVATALRAGLVPILCIGETKRERDAGKAGSVLARQLKIGLSLFPSAKGGSPPAGRAGASGGKPHPLNLIVAYEPVWAVGTGVPDRPEDTECMVRIIRSRVPRGTAILYGGSVTAQNLRSFLDHSSIDGVLVGGASIRISELRRMIRIIETYD